MFVKWSLLYIQCIDWFFYYLILYVASFHLDYCRAYVINCIYEKMIYLYVCEIIIIICPVHLLILYLLSSLCNSSLFEFLQRVCYWMFCKKWFLCMIVKWLSSFIQFIDWFFSCFDLYVISLHLHHCSWYVIGCFIKSHFVVCMWNINYSFISMALIDSLLDHIWIFFFFLLKLL